MIIILGITIVMAVLLVTGAAAALVAMAQAAYYFME